MTYYFDANHPRQLIEALSLVYGLEKGQSNNFRIYTSSEYGKVQPGAIFFLVDEEEGGLEINTRRLAEEGFTVFALKFPAGEYYVPFEIAEAVLKMWGRVLKKISENGPILYKYYCKSDSLKEVA